jgi:hypothetical protein
MRKKPLLLTLLNIIPWLIVFPGPGNKLSFVETIEVITMSGATLILLPAFLISSAHLWIKNTIRKIPALIVGFGVYLLFSLMGGITACLYHCNTTLVRNLVFIGIFSYFAVFFLSIYKVKKRK